MDTNLTILLFLLALLLAYVVVCWIAWCKIFKKAGLHPGKVFIPFYGEYLMYQIADSTGIFVGTIVLSVLRSLVSTFAIGAASSFAEVLNWLISAGLLGLNIIACNRLAKNFGKGTGFGIGLCVFPAIFLCILAFGDAEYIYNKKAKRTAAKTGTTATMPQTGWNQQRMQGGTPHSMTKPTAQSAPVDIRQTEAIADSKSSSASAPETLAEHLEYALQYSTISGMRGYLQRITKSCTEEDQQKLASVLSAQDPGLRDAVSELLNSEK